MTTRSGRAAALLISGTLLAGCAGGDDGKRAAVEIRGSDPTGAAPRASSAGAGGVVDYGDYQVAVARDGDTVASLASRLGLSASELAAYNGLQPTSDLIAGDELVLPEGTGLAAAGPAPAPIEPLPSAPIQAATLPPVTVGSAPLGQPGPVEVAVATTVTSDAPLTAPAATPAPAAEPEAGWSPDLAAAAIDRAESTGTAVEELPPPPSASDPLPPAPEEPRAVESPQLGRYQTQVDLPTPFELTRPVQGSVAIPYNSGAGPQKNDGVDFAAPAGAPVVAAEDGEVALVSESLGGLGTIVLVRHPNDLMTVYGRLDDVRVQKGSYVERGQTIGVVADAPAGTEPRMHFEVRQGADTLDPMSVL